MQYKHNILQQSSKLRRAWRNYMSTTQYFNRLINGHRRQTDKVKLPQHEGRIMVFSTMRQINDNVNGLGYVCAANRMCWGVYWKTSAVIYKSSTPLCMDWQILLLIMAVQTTDLSPIRVLYDKHINSMWQWPHYLYIEWPQQNVISVLPHPNKWYWLVK